MSSIYPRDTFAYTQKKKKKIYIHSAKPCTSKSLENEHASRL